MLENTENKAFTFSLWLSDHRGVRYHERITCVSIVAIRDTFHDLLCSIMLYYRVSIHKYEAYWHMNFSLIDGCGKSENEICGHSFFWSGVCEFTNIIIVTKKSKQTSVSKNL